MDLTTPIQPVYANAVGIKTTQLELILDFACQFGAPTGTMLEPHEVIPSVRLVLPISALEGLRNLIGKAADEHSITMAAIEKQIASK